MCVRVCVCVRACVCACECVRRYVCAYLRQPEWVSGYTSSGVGTKPYYPAFSAAGLDGNYLEEKHHSGFSHVVRISCRAHLRRVHHQWVSQRCTEDLLFGKIWALTAVVPEGQNRRRERLS